MELPNLMTTLSHVLNKLQTKGMDKDFKWTPNGFTLDDVKTYLPHELTIIKTYRFEELKDPADECVLYVIEANDGEKGYILNGYGVYSNPDMEFENAMRLIPEKDHQEQILFEL
jgi:hypothetical protein